MDYAHGGRRVRLAPTCLATGAGSPRGIRTVIFGARIDMGEASAIALALKAPDSVVVLDGRRAANRLHLPTTDTLGLLVAARQRGLLPAIRPLVQQLRAQGMHLAPEVEAAAYLLAGE